MAKMGDRRFGTNNNVALTGDVVTISQNNEVKTERTVRCVASETSHQNHDETKVLQEFRKPKSFSAAGLKSKTEHKEHHDADFCFLKSLVPDMKKLSDRRRRKFKELIVSSIGQLLNDGKVADHASTNACRFQHSITTDILQQANAACTNFLSAILFQFLGYAQNSLLCLG